MPDFQNNAIKGVERDVSDILSSGNYYVTPEISRELSHIQSDLNHLRLDSNLVNSSASWRNAQPGVTRNGDPTQSLNDASRILSGVRTRLDAKKVSSMQANQIRDAHHKSMMDLKDLKEGIRQYSDKAHERINQFSDHIGVSDRYTGYRSNLTRGSRDPFKLDSYWLKQMANQKVRFDETGINRGMSAPQRNPYDQYQTSRYASNLRSSVPQPAPKVQFDTSGSATARPHTTPATFKPASTQSIQEACGINTVYPGKTEYMTRYNKPPSLRSMGKGFTINPSPDFLIYGRPIAKAVYEPSFTEYQTRYEWPDGSKITKLPWLKE